MDEKNKDQLPEEIETETAEPGSAVEESELPAGVIPGPAPVTPPAPVAPKPAGDSVVLSAEAFQAFMAEFNQMKSDHTALMAIQNKNDLNKIDEMRRAGKLIKSVKVRKVNGKFIIGWKTLQDDVYFDTTTSRLVEVQRVEIYFEDKEKQELSMRQWAVLPEYVPFEVIGEMRDTEGNIYFRVKGDNGKEFEINSIYVN